MASGNKKTNILLSVVALLLLLVCVRSIVVPVGFDKERRQRESLVRQRLVAIRDAQLRYMREHGRFCGSLDTLVAAGYMADTVAVIPFGGGKRFSIEAGTAVTKAGNRQPTVECGALYEDFLAGLDAASVADVVAKAKAKGQYPGIRFGDRNKPGSTAVSWE